MVLIRCSFQLIRIDQRSFFIKKIISSGNTSHGDDDECGTGDEQYVTISYKL